MENDKLRIFEMAFGFTVLILCAIQADAAKCIPCSEAFSIMDPCKDYLMGLGPDEPTPKCCLAAIGLIQMAESQETRKATCLCFKEKESSLNPNRVEQLRQACAAKLPIYPTTDCSR
ncbi:hypothetical protein L6164_035850 [Bauhinia variegata]|uniref:Uncharacterized protein n=1 Tax=Bauhinia variegata TaxID=167791 RepID=A0ACB9KFC7_BAUVA|nr:hypothetical protein L6164_035850 [Bauhinia variegata]